MSSSANKTNVNDASEIDLSRLVGELIDHRKLIISVTSLFTLIAIIYALLQLLYIKLMLSFRLSRSKPMPY